MATKYIHNTYVCLHCDEVSVFARLDSLAALTEFLLLAVPCEFERVAIVFPETTSPLQCWCY